MKMNSHTRSGSSLAEVMIATALLAMAMLAFLGVTTLLVSLNEQDEITLVANNLAQKSIEEAVASARTRKGFEGLASSTYVLVGDGQLVSETRVSFYAPRLKKWTVLISRADPGGTATPDLSSPKSGLVTVYSTILVEPVR